ncbi:MAG TPA: YggS family pyridoxal phosphate-dependent enzyme [Terriglobales bacterium]|nr:YggS family pyridoxal phosphate-dependent enzyme [Terriglobales bacterium]
MLPLTPRPGRGDAIAANLAAVRARIEGAGGDPERIAIVAVTKGQPAEVCRAAVAAGLTVLGENRVLEALDKMGEVPGATWHLIGHLQTNKARHAGRFTLVQSLDSLRLAEALAARGRVAALLEVNVSREAQKSGVAPEQAVKTAAAVAGLVDLQGLMGMGPAVGDPRPAFAELRRLREQAEQRLGRPLPVLSMGMSEDLEAAVAEGTTMVRIGRALLGERQN